MNGVDARPCPEPNDENRDDRIALLLERWRRDDDADAFAEVFELVYDEVFRQAQYLLRRERRFNVPRTVSLVNTLFLKWIEKRPHSLQDKHDLMRFARRAMAQVLNEFGRGEQRRNNLLPRVFLEDAAQLERLGPTHEPLPLQNVALSALKAKHPTYFEVFMLKVEGFRQEEIAHRLGVSLPTVKRRFAAAKAFLRLELG